MNYIKNNENIKKNYDELTKKFIDNVVLKLTKTSTKEIKGKEREIFTSMINYYNHNIINKIEIEKSGLNCLLEKNIPKSPKKPTTKEPTTKKPTNEKKIIFYVVFL